MLISISGIIADHDFNLRGYVEPQAVADLAESIHAEGLLQPLVVTPDGDRFRLLAGFRRYVAVARVLKWEAVECTVVHADEDACQRINLRENIDRESLTVVQEAVGIERLYGKGTPIRFVAAELGKSPNWVLQRRQLRELPDEIQQKFASGLIPISKVSAVRRATNKEEAVKTILKNQQRKSNRDYKAEGKLPRPTQRQLIGFTGAIYDAEGGHGLAYFVMKFAVGRLSVDEFHKVLKTAIEARGGYYVP